MTEYPPLPQLSSADDAAYEWLLSDHPWAVAERARRRAAHHARELADADEALTITERLSATPDAGDPLHHVAEHVDRIARRAALTADVDDAEDLDAWTARIRAQYVTGRRVAGDWDYEYPAHLLGPSAADYPPPSLPPEADE